MTERRVVITGIGCLSPLGNDLEKTWDGLKNGRSGIRRIQNIDAEPFECKIAGEIRDFSADGYFRVPKDARRSDRYVQYAVAASKMCMADSGLDVEKIDSRRYGVMVGSGIGGLSTLEREHSVYRDKGPRRVSPFTIPMMISNIASGIISMEHGLHGPNMVIVTACATSNHNIGEAWRMIKFGDADGFLCGGAEAAILPMGLCGFANMKALSTRNDDPEGASRPFDMDRDGFVMGEGAGVVMIEELETAKARGAKIYAELIGYGVSADAYHLSAPSPDGSGPAYAIGMALRHGKVNPEDVDYLNAHATSTGLGDVADTNRVTRCVLDDDGAELFRCREISAGKYIELPLGAFDAAGRDFDVLPADGIFDFRCGQAIRGQLASIEPNAHRRFSLTVDAHISGTRQRSQSRPDE